ncbi:hypothetical protein TNCV_3762471 [Trichonephila clavipes]|nr:hypothetical protein TNCV_3762471 [Trichonephila clavipes]
MKSLVYASPVDSDEALVAKIAVVAGEIREVPGVFANVRHSLRRWYEACTFAGGRFFEQFLRFRKKIMRVPFSMCHHSFNLHSYSLRMYIKLFLFILSREVLLMSIMDIFFNFVIPLSFTSRVGGSSYCLVYDTKIGNNFTLFRGKGVSNCPS